MEVGFNFFAGLILGAILGLIIGLLIGTAVAKPEEKKATKTEHRAEKLFKLALKQENRKKKMKLMGRILEKFPHSEWADKALEEVMKMKKGGPET